MQRHRGRSINHQRASVDTDAVGVVAELGPAPADRAAAVDVSQGRRIHHRLERRRQLDILKAIDRTLGLRVDAEQELTGLDLAQHEEQAYNLS